MARVRKRCSSADPHLRRVIPRSVSSFYSNVSDDDNHKKRSSRVSQKKDWENATCSVCLEHPHNAVLLLCSCNDKGCRPYICATSYRHSNCLEQFKKAYAKVTDTHFVQPLHGEGDDAPFIPAVDCLDGETGTSKLLCPLCRGQVKGWTVIKPARKHLNSKKRTCMEDECTFLGTYRELRKHVRAEHPLARPREVDPAQVEKWKKLENERELNDVFSTIRSITPGAIVMGDYVVEGPVRGSPRNYPLDNDALFQLDAFGGRRNGDARSTGMFYEDYDTLAEPNAGGDGAASGDLDNDTSRVNWRLNRVLLRRLMRRRIRTRVVNRV